MKAVNCCSGTSKEEALNCVEWLLADKDITIQEYEALTTVIKMMRRGKIDLGDGICLVLSDDSV